MIVLSVTEGVVVLLLAVLVIGLLRSHAEILRALHDLGVNLDEAQPSRDTATFDLRRPDAAASNVVSIATAAELHRDRPHPQGLAVPVDGPLGDARDVMGVTPAGDAVAVAVSGIGHLTLLAFLSSGCATCRDFWAAFAEEPNREVAGPGSNLVVVTRGPQSESPSDVASLAHPDLLTVLSSDAFEDYSVPVAPYFVLVDGATDRVIGEGAAASFDQLRSLLSKAVADGGFGPGGRRSRRDFLSGRARAARVDRGLAEAGIGPGHPSLYPPDGLAGTVGSVGSVGPAER